jgi:hypothetical protein
VKTTPTLFEIEDPSSRGRERVAPVVVEATEDDVTGVAGIALFGELSIASGSSRQLSAGVCDRSVWVATPGVTVR